MISVDSLLYKIDQKLNKLSSNEHQEIPLEDKILILNEAQIKLIKQKFVGIGNSMLGMDSFLKRYEDLENLVVDYTPLQLNKKDLVKGEWWCDVSSLTPKYMFYVNSYIIADKGECKDRIIWINQDLSKHGDIQILLNNEHYKPSFEYQETFHTLSEGKLTVYTNDEFTPKKLYLMYLRYPVEIDKEGYEKFDGSDSVTTDCELKDYLEDELLDIATQLLAMYTENIVAAQSAQARMQTND